MYVIMSPDCHMMSWLFVVTFWIYMMSHHLVFLEVHLVTRVGWYGPMDRTVRLDRWTPVVATVACGPWGRILYLFIFLCSLSIGPVWIGAVSLYLFDNL